MKPASHVDCDMPSTVIHINQAEKKEKHAYYGLTIPVTWQPFKQALSHQHQVFYGLQIVYGFMKR